MKMTPASIKTDDYPAELHSVLRGAKLFDSSCSPNAKVIFVDKGEGYFVKTAPKGTLSREAALMRYIHSKGLTSAVLSYISAEKDYLLTEKIKGDDCIAAKYLAEPERLCDVLAERLRLLHGEAYNGCPVQNHTELLLEVAAKNRRDGTYDKTHFPCGFGFSTVSEAWAVIERSKRLLRNDTLLHGDYCMPNIILDDWKFSGFVDLDTGGVGDRHYDLFWGIWSLFFNLKTHKYRDRFLDAYGRDKVDGDRIRLVAAISVFG